MPAETKANSKQINTSRELANPLHSGGLFISATSQGKTAVSNLHQWLSQRQPPHLAWVRGKQLHPTTANNPFQIIFLLGQIPLPQIYRLMQHGLRVHDTIILNLPFSKSYGNISTGLQDKRALEIHCSQPWSLCWNSVTTRGQHMMLQNERRINR